MSTFIGIIFINTALGVEERSGYSLFPTWSVKSFFFLVSTTSNNLKMTGPQKSLFLELERVQ